MLMHYAAQQKKTTDESQVYFSKVIANGENASVHEIPEASGSNVVDGPRRLHITNLPFKIRDNELRSMFEAYGTVIDAEIIFNERGSKGFGFVTMENVDAAAMAKEALNGKEMDGRKIEVNNATPRAAPSKNTLRSKNKAATLVKTSYNELLPATPALPTQAIANGWAPQAFALSSAPVPSPQLTLSPPQIAPPPPFSFTSPTPPIGMPGFHCYPTPEQYAAQYYGYIASHGTLRSNVPKTNSIGNYRFQPY